MIKIAEQQYFDLEKQLINSNSQLESESSAKTSLQSRLTEIGKYL